MVSDARSKLIKRAIKKGFIFKIKGKEMSEEVKSSQIEKMLFDELSSRKKRSGIRNIKSRFDIREQSSN